MGSDIVGDLEAAVTPVGNAVIESTAEFQPDGQLRVLVAFAGRCPEEVHLLAGHLQVAPQQVMEKARQPGAAGEDVGIGLQPGAVGKFQRLHPSVV